jgi:hypothetical protein
MSRQDSRLLRVRWLVSGDNHLAGNAQLRRAMGLAGRKRVEQEFSFTGRLQRIEALYGKIVGRSHASHTAASSAV